MIPRSAWALAVALTLIPVSAVAAENAGSTDLSTIQANGSPEPIRTGFFTETSLGAFLTVGGDDSYSSTAGFLGLGFGYDIIPNLSAGIQFRLAPNVSDCYATDSKGNRACPPNANAFGPNTFTMVALEAKVSYRIPISDRLFVPIRVFGGVNLLTPNPQPANANDNGLAVQPSIGGATGIEWATPFDHFTIGAEISGEFVLQLNAIALAAYPNVKYTF